MNIRDAFIVDDVEEKKMWNKKRICQIKKKDKIREVFLGLVW
jgi:hypothetical protein